jgi:hypothetical protein
VSNDAQKFLGIIADLDHLLVPGTGEGFWSARPIFAEMNRAFLNGWSLCRVKELLDDSDFLVFRDRNALTVNITKGYAISLALIESPPHSLYLFPQHYMARNVGRTPLTVHRYSPDRPVRNEMYDPDVRLELREEFELQPGQSIERNGYTEVLDWEWHGTTGHVLRLHSEGLGYYEWGFDRETLAPTGVTMLDGFASQVATAMQMLTTLGMPVDNEFIDAGLASPDFHVRWETLKMINHLAPQRTQETLDRLKGDPHPAIRKAVERTLALSVAKQSAGD